MKTCHLSYIYTWYNSYSKSFRLKKNLLLSVLLILSFPSFSQRSIDTDTLYINHIGQEKGLLQLNPIAIEQDSNGFLWVGTEDGLHRYNSYKFKTFTHQKNNYSSILDDHVRDILYINDTLWIASNSAGILCYSIKENSFSRLKQSKEYHLYIKYL